MKKSKVPDQYNLSYGNIEVLKHIPEMMLMTKYRKKLRLLVIEWIFETSKGKKFK